MKSSTVWCSTFATVLALGTGLLAGCSERPAEAPPTTQAGYASDIAGQATAAPMADSDGVGAEVATKSSRASREMGPAEQPQARPGLGTTWGETRSSVITSSPFVRADAQSPFATAAVFYNDEQGAKSMASASGFKRFSHGSVEIGGGVATVSLKDGSDNFLNGFEASGKKFLIGESGERYSIVIESHVPARLEVVVSVDGLDVLDGKEATFKKRGYLIDPHGTIEIDGFRQSMQTVAAFRFGSVRDSYASQKHGETRNVGVIGVAAFNEQGTNPSSWTLGDTGTRLQADPFPGRFATPPGH